MSDIFETTAQQRLETFFLKRNENPKIEQLTPDASTRAFFRIGLNGKSAIATVYPERFDETLPQIDVTNLFIQCDLPVAEIFEINYDLGLLVHEDFGDRILRDVLEASDKANRERLLNDAISLIAKIQQNTPKAFELGSIASRLKFDEEKLLWELNFFKTHYFESLKKSPLALDDNRSLTNEFIELSKELAKHAAVLTHRDFHAANLMVGDDGALRIIDHQDARIGSVTYDLVSLLLDRISEIPSVHWLNEKKQFFLSEREKVGLQELDPEQFEYEFDLMTIQRCLKAIGTFSNQVGNFGKTEYLQYIEPMLTTVSEVCERTKRFPQIQKTITE